MTYLFCDLVAKNSSIKVLARSKCSPCNSPPCHRTASKSSRRKQVRSERWPWSPFKQVVSWVRLWCCLSRYMVLWCFNNAMYGVPCYWLWGNDFAVDLPASCHKKEPHISKMATNVKKNKIQQGFKEKDPSNQHRLRHSKNRAPQLSVTSCGLNESKGTRPYGQSSQRFEVWWKFGSFVMIWVW